MHGKSSAVTKVTVDPLFAGLPDTFQAARYHSLAADKETMPDCLAVTAIADDGEIMAVRHRDMPVFGVQFHPESVLTPLGWQMLANFAAITV